LFLIASIIDITQKKLSDQLIKESEEKYRMLAENATDIVWVLDIKTQKFTYISQAIEKIQGYTVEEALEMPFNKMLSPENYQIAINDLTETLKQDSSTLIARSAIRKYEFNELHKNGSTISTETFLHLLFDENKKPVSVMGATRDITERKKAELSLINSEERLHSLFTNMSEGVAFHRLEFNSEGTPINYKILEVNQQYEDILDIRKEDVIDKLATEIYNVKEPPYLNEFSQVALSGISSKIETYFEPMKKHFDISIVPWGEKGFATIFSDITKRKKAEKELREANLKFNNAFMYNSSIIIITSLKDGKYIEVNDAFLRDMEYKREEVVGKTSLQLNIFDDYTERRKIIVDVLNGNGIDNREIKFITKSGKVFIGLLSAVTIPLYGKPHLLSNIIDITKRKEAEAALSESEARFDLALKSANMGAWHWEIKNDKRNFDQVSCSLLGIDFSKFTGSPNEFFDIVHPDDRMNLKKALALTLGENTTYKPEYRVIWPDGSIHFIAARGKLIYDKNGNPLKINGIIWDISERKLIEDILRESEEKYRNIYNNIQDVYYEASIEGNIIEASPSIMQMSKFTREEIIGRSLNEIYPDKKIREKLIDELLKKGKVYNYEVPLKDKDGEINRCSVTSKLIFDGEGKPLKIVGSMRNIEELKRNEEARFDLELKYGDLVYNISDVIFSIDLKGILRTINPAIEKILGYKTEELIGENVFDFVSPSHKKSVLQKMKDRINGIGTSAYYEIDMISKSGGIVTFDITTFLQYLNNKPYEVFCIARDITEKKRLTVELKNTLSNMETLVVQRTGELYRQEELYRTTVNSLNDWIFVIDDQYKLVFTNQALNDFFINNGVTGNLIGKNIKDIFYFLGENDFVHYEKVFTTAKKEEISDGEYFAFGSKYYTQTKIYPIMRDDKIVRVVTTVHDYTKLKLIEDDIRKNLEREKELNVLKSRFITTVSHEFRTPLAGIYSSVQLLKKYNEKWDFEKKEKMYKQIFDAVQHTKNMLDDISLVDKEENDQPVNKPKNIDLQELLEQITEENSQIYGGDFNIICEYNLVAKKYNMDPLIIRHIFSNIISNAIKYSGESRKININVLEENNKIIFTIIDYGIGIPDIDQKHLFDPFFRASNTDAIQGTGFGLTIVKRYITLIQGDILIESKIKEGTKVTITIPFMNESN